jgi:hypothetical protein
MPQFNLGELCSMATQNVGRRDDIPASTVSQRVNQAYFEVASSIEDALTERLAVSSTTSGENRIDLPADCFEVLGVTAIWSWSTSTSATSNYRPLRRMSGADTDQQGPFPVAEPRGYVQYNSWLELHPSPDSAYSLQMRYRSMVTDMMSLTDVPSIATNYRPAILLKTEEHLHRYLGNYGAAAALEQAYINYMTRQKTTEARRQADENRYGVGVMTRFNTNRSRSETGGFDMESF